MAVDLNSEDGRALVRRLAVSADVLVENFRPGTAARLGLGYEELSAVKPRLVYGPMSQHPGYDAIAQAMSGAMSMNG